VRGSAAFVEEDESESGNGGANENGCANENGDENGIGDQERRVDCRKRKHRYTRGSIRSENETGSGSETESCPALCADSRDDN
jgi:hypothetical protein